MRKLFYFLFLWIISAACNPSEAQVWSPAIANQWYAKQAWIVGCNFIPSTAINQLEMWQAETFDTLTIDRELGLAASIGMNTVRVFLHDLAYRADPEGFKQRMQIYLEIANRHDIRTSFVFFDKCWNPHPKIGKQPDPRPGIHNSGWVKSPSKEVTNDCRKRREWGRLELYVKDILNTFKDDPRILYWDLYNEPSDRIIGGVRTMPLMKEIFKWARAAGPSQPLTSGIFFIFPRYNKFQLSHSDIITFHNYNDAKHLQREIGKLKQRGRPLICTEWMARTRNSNVVTHLPIFKKENVGCLNWGLVSGKTQTIYPWFSKSSTQAPKVWFHDLFYPDGQPYRQEETDMFKKLSSDHFIK